MCLQDVVMFSCLAYRGDMDSITDDYERYHINYSTSSFFDELAQRYNDIKILCKPFHCFDLTAKKHISTTKEYIISKYSEID